MRISRLITGAGLAAVLLVGSSMASQAATTSSTASVNGIATFTTSLLLNKFDSTLGTLTGITITLNADITPGLYLQNTNQNNDYNFDTGSATVDFQITAPDVGATNVHVSASTPSNISGVAVAANHNQGLGNPNGISVFPGSPATGLNSTVNVAAANFASYIGVGAQTISFSGDTNRSTSAASVNGAPAFTVTNGAYGPVAATATIVYTYTPAGTAPEPGSFVMAGFGLIGMVGGGVIRRRKRTA